MTLSEYLECEFLSERGTRKMYYRACRNLGIEPPKNEFGNLIVTPEIKKDVEKQIMEKKKIKDLYTFEDPLPECFRDLKDDDSDLGE